MNIGQICIYNVPLVDVSGFINDVFLDWEDDALLNIFSPKIDKLRSLIVLVPVHYISNGTHFANFLFSIADKFDLQLHDNIWTEWE